MKPTTNKLLQSIKTKVYFLKKDLNKLEKTLEEDETDETKWNKTL
jgi:hypothetical protein